MESRYRESEKKIHKSPYVDPGESAVDLPQDIIRQGGDLILLKKPITWTIPAEAPYSDYARSGSAGGAYGGSGGGIGGRGANSDYGGSKYGSGGYGVGAGGLHGSHGGGGVGGGIAGGYGAGAGGIGAGTRGAGGYHGGASLGSPYGLSSTPRSEGYYSGSSGHGYANASNDYAAPYRNQGGYPVSIKRSASHGDSSSTFTPAMSDEYASSRIVSLSSPQKHAGVNAFPVSPADARLSSWASQTSPGGSSMIIAPGGSSTTTTEYKRLYQSSVLKRTTANGSVTFNESQNQQSQEQGKYYS